MVDFLSKGRNDWRGPDFHPGRFGNSASAFIPIEETFSLYLDLVRFLAALSVFVMHSVQYNLYHGYVPLAAYGHDAVTVFFVLSGLVIAATASRPGETWKTYMIARASRIYSVAIPAIALCYALTGFASLLAPDFPLAGPGNADLSLATSVSAALFLLQSWHSQNLLWNTPYWSLCYEVWYYLIFGAIFFIGDVRWRAAVALSAAVIAGPAILLLFPVWLLGVWVARHPGFSIGKAAGGAIFLGSWAAVAILNEFDVAAAVAKYLHANVPSYWRLSASQRFVTDYLLGLLIAFNFIAFRAIQGHLARAFRALAPAIRFLAGYTFSLYLYHYPMIRFCEAVFPNTTNSTAVYCSTMTAVFAMCLLLGHFTEKQKWVVRAAIARLAGAVARLAEKARPPLSAT